MGASDLEDQSATEDDGFIYNAAIAALYFDADGLGGRKQTLLVTLANHALLRHENISVIA